MVSALKKKKASQKGALAPLFERLTDLDPHTPKEKVPYDRLDLEGLRRSILAELSLILNTRPTAKRQAETPAQDHLADYALPAFFGLGDFSWFEAGSEFYLHQVARRIEEVIGYYEPRLKNPRVKVAKGDQPALGIQVEVSGEVFLEGLRERLNFPIAIENLFLRS